MQQGSGIIQLLTIVIIFVIFWVLLIWPQMRRQKQHKKMIESLQKGDRVITIGGIYGTITYIGDKTVTMKVDENTKIEVDKNAIAGIVERKAKEEK